MATEVKVPVLPESVSDATIAGWHKKVGDSVKRDENLVDLETDKVVLEVPAPADGVIRQIVEEELGDLYFVRASTKGNSMSMGPHTMDLLLQQGADEDCRQGSCRLIHAHPVEQAALALAIANQASEYLCREPLAGQSHPCHAPDNEPESPIAAKQAQIDEHSR